MRWILALPVVAACAPASIPGPVTVPLGGLEPSTPPIVVGASASTPTPGPAPSGGTPYLCDTGERIAVAYRGRSAVVNLPDGRSRTLPAVESASGARYAEPGLVWFVEGPSGILTDRGGQAQCREV